MSTTKAQRFESIGHYLTAFVVLLKGIDKIDLGKPAIGVLFVLFALIIVLGTFFHHKAVRLLRHFKAYIFVMEAIVIGMVGYLYLKDGKQFLPYVCFLASAVFIVALIIYIKKSSASNSKH